MQNEKLSFHVGWSYDIFNLPDITLKSMCSVLYFFTENFPFFNRKEKM